MLRDPSTVCYSRSTQTDEPRTGSKSVMRSWTGTHLLRTGSYHSLPKTNTVILPPGAAQTDEQPVPPRQPFALDYSNYIVKRYPKMSSQPIAVLLREQNARAIRHVTMACQSIQCDMVNFTDKLMSALASSCTCCTARGLLDCPLRPEPPVVDEQSASGHSKRKGVTIGFTGSAEACYRTPKAPD